MAAAERAAAFDIVALGEAMVEFNQLVDRRAGGDGRQAGRHYLQGFGGDTSNAVIAAARQGARCAYLTRLGEDPFGRLCLDLWHEEGVDVQGVGIDPAAPTGVYFVHHDEAGHHFSYLRAGSAASRMTPATLPAALIRSSRWLHVSGIGQAISESSAQTVRAAMQIARDAGVQVAYDPNVRPRLWPLDRAREVVAATIALADLFLPGSEDLRLLAGLGEPQAQLAWCHAAGARTVVLKDGARGAWLSEGGRVSAVPAFVVDTVDATGAGDCFDGNLLARRAAGDGWADAARWAAAAAALATTGVGAVAPLPRADAVRALLARGPARPR